MDYDEFFAKFGGSARTKNIQRMSPPHVPRGDVTRNLRIFSLPERSGLPPEFIRLDPWEMQYVFTVARRARHGIVEIGRFSGGSCFLMSCAAPTAPIFSIDFGPQNDELLIRFFKQHSVGQNVTLYVGDFQRTKYPDIPQVDVLFIDGDRSYQGCMADIVNWYEKLLPNGHLLFHDSYLGGEGVQDAIADFMDDHPELQVVQSPFIGAHYWHYPAGSIAHLIKR